MPEPSGQNSDSKGREPAPATICRFFAKDTPVAVVVDDQVSCGCHRLPIRAQAPPPASSRRVGVGIREAGDRELLPLDPLTVHRLTTSCISGPAARSQEQNSRVGLSMSPPTNTDQNEVADERTAARTL